MWGTWLVGEWVTGLCSLRWDMMMVTLNLTVGLQKRVQDETRWSIRCRADGGEAAARWVPHVLSRPSRNTLYARTLPKKTRRGR
jgi:hypothetical protein